MKTQEKDTRHVNLSLTVNEAIALNNHTMDLIEASDEVFERTPLKRAARKLLDTLNAVDPVEPK